MIRTALSLVACLTWLLPAAAATGDWGQSAKAGQSLGLAGSTWWPVELGGAPVPGKPDSPAQFIRFKTGGKLAGNAGCNRFFGEFTTVGDRLEFGAMGVTRMACPRPVMAWEDRFVRAIQATERYARQGATLILMDGEGKVVARLRQRDFD